MEQIDLYSTHCPKCIMLESRMKAKKINYNLITDFDVEEIKSKGFMSMPILVVNGEYMEFTNAMKWVSKR